MDRDRVAGSAENVAGKVQKAAGEAFGDQKAEAKGLVDQAAGASRAAWGHAKDGASEYLDQAGGYVDEAREAAERALQRGRRYLDEGLDKFPEAGEALYRGREVVGREVREHPLVTLLIAGAVGYGLALLLHARGSDPSPPARQRGRSRN